MQIYLSVVMIMWSAVFIWSYLKEESEDPIEELTKDDREYILLEIIASAGIATTLVLFPGAVLGTILLFLGVLD